MNARPNRSTEIQKFSSDHRPQGFSAFSVSITIRTASQKSTEIVGDNVGDKIHRRKDMAKLAIKTLEALTPADAGRTIHDDGGLRGKVRANAKAEHGVSVTFQYRYRWEGRWRDEPCGTWPRDKITEVRSRRDQVKRLLDEHIDPAEHRKAKNLKVQADAAENMRRIAEEQAIEAARLAEIERMNSRTTVLALFERWSALELKQRKDGGAETRRGFDKDVLPAIGRRYAEEVKRADIMGILDSVKARGANRLANRLLAEMRQMFGFAAVREIIPTD
ncbi:MAG: phage integrase central domain-containing protein, partial [Trinickia sp.]